MIEARQQWIYWPVIFRIGFQAIAGFGRKIKSRKVQ
jgi:hypothetical protein